jgi:hypothetical protein
MQMFKNQFAILTNQNKLIDSKLLSHKFKIRKHKLAIDVIMWLQTILLILFGNFSNFNGEYLLLELSDRGQSFIHFLFHLSKNCGAIFM